MMDPDEQPPLPKKRKCRCCCIFSIVFFTLILGAAATLYFTEFYLKIWPFKKEEPPQVEIIEPKIEEPPKNYTFSLSGTRCRRDIPFNKRNKGEQYDFSSFEV